MSVGHCLLECHALTEADPVKWRAQCLALIASRTIWTHPDDCTGVVPCNRKRAEYLKGLRSRREHKTR